VICQIHAKNPVRLQALDFFAALLELPLHFTFRSYKDGKINENHSGGPADEQASQSSYYGR
jgi:hypothetical protein